MTDGEVIDRVVDHLGETAAICDRCGAEVPTAGAEPLAFLTCPQCRQRVLCPAEVEGYWLVRYLASGGMGVVYQAFHEDAGNVPYAVKLARPHGPDDCDPVRNLQHEIDVLTAMEEHPCMVRMVAARRDGIQPFLAMDYVDGCGVDQELEAGRLVEPLEALAIGLRILAAEANIVHQGYLYRDLKPGNIILAHDGRAVLCDFGICRPLSAVGEDNAPTLQGSVHYVPPERLTGEGEEPASEIYSLGMVLFHLITGEPFFHGTPLDDVPELHVETPDEQREARLEPLGQPIAGILGEMVRRRPRDRYRSFLELERDLFAAWSRLSGLARAEVTNG